MNQEMPAAMLPTTREERLRRPPDRQLGFLFILGAVIAAGVTTFILSIDEYRDLLGPVGSIATPVFFAAVVGSTLLSGISDLQPPDAMGRIVSLRRLSTIGRVIAGVAWVVGLFGMFVH